VESSRQTMPLKRGPNATTVADGFSLTDQREPVFSSNLDFNYEEDSDDEDIGQYPSTRYLSGLDHHLPNPDAPKMTKSHEGEHRGDFGSVAINVTKYTKVMAFFAAINSCNLGYDIGVNTSAGPMLQTYMNLSDTQLEIFFGSLNLFAMAGAICAHFISDRHGRRWAFIVAAVFFVCGCAVLVSATDFSSLMVGRTFIGLGVGFGLAIDPIYISEISPAAHRGELVTWSEISTNVGILLGFCSGLVFASFPDSSSWRYMFGVGAFLPLVVIFLAKCVMPESPRWLLQKGRVNDARNVLEKIYPPGYDIGPIILDMHESLERENLMGKKFGWDLILFPTPALKRMLLVGVGTAMAQQAVGIDAIQYFLLFIIQESGIKGRGAQTGVLIFLGFLKLIFIVIGGKMFDRRGRRPLFFISLCGMSAALLMLSINFFGTTQSSTFGIFGLAIYLSFFSLGMGPGSWLIPSEVFSTSIRAKAMSLATFMNRLIATIMASSFLSVANAMSWSAFFFLLSMICLLVLGFLYLYLPETNGRSLEDMSMYFAEITQDRSMLDAEAKITREREAREYAAKTERRFEPLNISTGRSQVLKDAKVIGTMAD